MSDNVTTLKGKRGGGPETVEGFGCGAVVELKSGGPAATVRCAVKSETGGPMVRLDWFDEEGIPASADFFVAQLKRVEDLPVDEAQNKTEADAE